MDNKFCYKCNTPDFINTIHAYLTISYLFLGQKVIDKIIKYYNIDLFKRKLDLVNELPCNWIFIVIIPIKLDHNFLPFQIEYPVALMIVL